MAKKKSSKKDKNVEPQEDSQLEEFGGEESETDSELATLTEFVPPPVFGTQSEQSTLQEFSESDVAALADAQDALEAELGLSAPTFSTQSEGSSGVVSDALALGPFGQSNIVGTAIAEKEQGPGRFTGELSIAVLVREKTSSAAEAGGALIPSTINGIPTDVVPAPIELQATQCGEACKCVLNGHIQAGGTIGALCVRSGDSRLYMLSNAHVLTPNPAAQTRNGNLVHDGQGRTIGQTMWWSNFDTVRENLADAALAHTAFSLVDPSHPTFRLSTNVVPVSEYRTGMRVQKYGQRTKETFGTIRSWRLRTLLEYEGFRRSFRFRNQLWIRAASDPYFSRKGDSGSLVVTRDGQRPIGLLFGGGGADSVANRIVDVMRIFGISRFVNQPV